MGSGQGKSRRAQSAQGARSLHPIRYDGVRWAEFLQSINLKEMTLFEYYSYKIQTFPFVALADREEVIRELFHDAVDVGALTLPGSYQAQDFDFSVSEFSPAFRRSTGNPGWGSDLLRVDISLKDEFGMPYEYMVSVPVIDEHTLASEPGVESSLMMLLYGIREVVEAATPNPAPSSFEI